MRSSLAIRGVGLGRNMAKRSSGAWLRSALTVLVLTIALGPLATPTASAAVDDPLKPRGISGKNSLNGGLILGSVHATPC